MVTSTSQQIGREKQFFHLSSDGGIQEKTHKMDHLMEDMFNDVNYLIACQRFVSAKVRFLEEKTLELTQIIQNLDVSSYKETLENQINTMEMKLSINGDTDRIEKKALAILLRIKI